MKQAAWTSNRHRYCRRPGLALTDGSSRGSMGRKDGLALHFARANTRRHCRFIATGTLTGVPINAVCLIICEGVTVDWRELALALLSGYVDLMVVGC